MRVLRICKNTGTDGADLSPRLPAAASWGHRKLQSQDPQQLGQWPGRRPPVARIPRCLPDRCFNHLRKWSTGTRHEDKKKDGRLMMRQACSQQQMNVVGPKDGPGYAEVSILLHRVGACCPKIHEILSISLYVKSAVCSCRMSKQFYHARLKC